MVLGCLLEHTAISITYLQRLGKALSQWFIEVKLVQSNCQQVYCITIMIILDAHIISETMLVANLSLVMYLHAQEKECVLIPCNVSFMYQQCTSILNQCINQHIILYLTGHQKSKHTYLRPSPTFWVFTVYYRQLLSYLCPLCITLDEVFPDFSTTTKIDKCTSSSFFVGMFLLLRRDEQRFHT